MSANATLESIRTLPLGERVELLFSLWDDLLDEGWKPELDDQTREELNRRYSNYQANPASGLTWEQVVAHVRRPR